MSEPPDDNFPHTATTNVVFLDDQVFLPMLDNDETKEYKPYYVANPLTETQFSTSDLKDSVWESVEAYINDLNNMTDIVRLGFGHMTSDLDREQWFRTVAQLVASIQQGLYKSRPGEDPLAFQVNLNPDEGDALLSMTRAIGALNHFFTNPLTTDQAYWQQCSRCLQVSGTTVTSRLSLRDATNTWTQREPQSLTASSVNCAWILSHGETSSETVSGTKQS
jgi:hypothetical protein